MRSDVASEYGMYICKNAVSNDDIREQGIGI